LQSLYKEKKKTYYILNRPEIKERCKLYAQSNKDSIKEYRKAYYEKHRDRYRELKKGFDVKNKEKNKQVRRAYYLKNKDKFNDIKKAYYWKNRDKCLERNRSYYHGKGRRAKKVGILKVKMLIALLECNKLLGGQSSPQKISGGEVGAQGNKENSTTWTGAENKMIHESPS
jgi:hypothetical protein